MRNVTCFNANTLAQFDNKYDNMIQFNQLILDTSRKIYDKYSKDEANKIIRTQFDRVLGITFKLAKPMERMQAYRAKRIEIAQLIEDTLLDRMNSGWNSANARFMEYVEEKNIAEGDTNEFYVSDASLLQVSRFAGNHNDIIRQSVRPGVSFRVDTSWYVVKVYTDFELFMLGRIDWAAFVDKIYTSIEDYRYSELYTAFMTMDKSLPTDMKLETPLSEATRDSVVDQIEAVKAATGREVLLVGTRTAIQKLQNTVNYNLFSEAMKEERHQKGILGNWEGYECLALDRVNKTGTRENVFSADDNKKIYILPVDPEFKPIKRVNAGTIMYNDYNTNGTDNMDMTMAADVRYQEGIGVVINQIFGEILIQ